MEACVGAAALTELKVFQGLDGQWKGLSGTSGSGEADGLETVVSSSEDSSFTEAWVAVGWAMEGF